MPKKVPDFDAQTIAFQFGDAGEVTVAMADLKPEIVAKLAVHGLSQKLGDSYAGAAKATESLDMTADEYAKNQVEAVFKQLTEGEWSTRTPGGPRITDLVQAFADTTGYPVEDVAEQAQDWTKEEKDAIRKHPQVKARLSEIRAERQAAKAAKDAAAAENAEASTDLASLMG